MAWNSTSSTIKSSPLNAVQSQTGDGKPSPVLFLASGYWVDRQRTHRYRRVALHIVMCNNLHMPTNLALDDRLIEEARKTGGHKTKKEAVTTALEEYIRHHKQMRILEAFGTVDFDPEYDYKAERRRKRT